MIRMRVLITFPESAREKIEEFLGKEVQVLDKDYPDILLVPEGSEEDIKKMDEKSFIFYVLEFIPE